MDVVEKIERITALAKEKGHDDEFILSRHSYKETVNHRTGVVTPAYVEWRAGVTNRYGFVALGEAEPQFAYEATTAIDAIDGLLAIMEALT